MLGISVKNFSIKFGNTQILKDVNFTVKEGEIVTILGPSGSGKSTILRSISSLENTYEGEILLNETCLVSQKECNKDIGYIFQDYALFPHLNVQENISFALDNLKKKEKEKRVHELLKQFDLYEHKNKQIHELSGGQQQRVSIARVLAYKPKVLLLDEPFSNLDSILRKKTKLWLKKIIKELGLSAILVTHDQKEALSISDKIGIINNKTLEQFDSPQKLYENPKSLYIANFLGHVNILPSTMAKELQIPLKDDETLIIRIEDTKVTTTKTKYQLNLLNVSYCGSYYEIEAYIKGFDNSNIEFISKDNFSLKQTLYLDVNKENITCVKND